MATVAIQPAAELTPAQKRFNTLLARVSQLSDSIATLEALSTQHRSSHLSAMNALKCQEDAVRKSLLLFLDARLHTQAHVGHAAGHKGGHGSVGQFGGVVAGDG